MKLPLDIALARCLEPALASYIDNVNQSDLREALETVFAWMDERARPPEAEPPQPTLHELRLLASWIAPRSTEAAQ